MAFHALIAASLILGSVASVRAEEAQSQSSKGYRSADQKWTNLENRGYRFGLEVELTGEVSLGRVLKWFDMNSAIGPEARDRIFESMSESEWQAYLTPARLEALPAEWKAQVLTESLGNKLEIQEKPRVEVPKLQLQNEIKVPARGPGIVRPGSPTEARSQGGIILQGTGASPTNSPARSSELVLDPSVKAQRAYEGAIRRFLSELREATPEKRQALAGSGWFNLNGISDVRKVIHFKEGDIKVKAMVPAQGLPPKTRQMLDRMEWTRDLSALELVHKEPLTDPRKYLEDLNRIASEAGITRFLEDPTATEPDRFGFSYHFNVSREGVNPAPLARRLNRLHLGQLAEQGRADTYLLAADGMNGFNPNSASRGIVRVHQGRTEVRAHVESPEKELLRWTSYLEDDGQARMQSDWNRVRKHLPRWLEQVVPPGSTHEQQALGLVLGLDDEVEARSAWWKKAGEQRIAQLQAEEGANWTNHFEERLSQFVEGAHDRVLAKEYFKPVFQAKAKRLSEMAASERIAEWSVVSRLSFEASVFTQGGRVQPLLCEEGSDCPVRELVRRQMAQWRQKGNATLFAKLNENSALFLDASLNRDWNVAIVDGLNSSDPKFRLAAALTAWMGVPPPQGELASRSLRLFDPSIVSRLLTPNLSENSQALEAILRLYRRLPLEMRRQSDWKAVGERIRNFAEANWRVRPLIERSLREIDAEDARALLNSANRGCARSFGGL